MADAEAGKRKGRPLSAPAPYPAGPMETWLDELSPTAHRILRAARGLLLEKGFAAVTLEGVALEAGEDRATITRHFGSKAGLLNALFDDLGNDIFEDLSAQVAALPAGDLRRHTFVRSLAGLSTDPQLALGMFELMPHALRDPILRDRFAALYVLYRKLMLEQSGIAERLSSLSAYEDRQDVAALPALLMAVIDGMSFQSSLDPKAVDCDRVFALLDLLVSAVLDGRLTTGGRPEKGDRE
jgi:AcrR family transcriptional regulator